MFGQQLTEKRDNGPVTGAPVANRTVLHIPAHSCTLCYTGNRYEQVLNEQVLPHFTVPEMDQAIFQRDGGPHFANPVKRLMTTFMTVGLVVEVIFYIGNPDPPDLTVCDFFLCGYLKEQV
ncbi:hypothetical protein J6590_053512 [Homalodisca vitripennis]|nr:hypothetical protein J6590_053512 [Homalodisca vitripennis]